MKPAPPDPVDTCVVRTLDGAKVAATRGRMPEPSEVAATVVRFKALADPLRVTILHALAEAGELCVCDVAATVDAPESTVSHALRWLRGAHVVATRRSGRMVLYRLADDAVAQLLAFGGAPLQSEAPR